MTHPSHSALDALPTEIWLKIFDKIAQHLPQDAFFDVSLTCRAFREFSLPFIYRTLEFHPFAIDGDSKEHWKRSEWSSLPPTQMTREIQRLDFYSSDSIAKCVCHLYLRPWLQFDSDENPKLPVEASADLDSLVCKFYEAVPCFKNTQRFECVHTEIGGFAWRQVSQLPKLRDMDIAGCRLLSSVPPSPILNLRTFKLWHMAMPEELETAGIDRWLAMLDPNSLEFLQVGPARASTLFFQGVHSAGPFQALSAINVAVMSEQMLACMPVFLSKTPALRRLNLPLFGSVRGNAGMCIAKGLKVSELDSPAPHLEDYWGPYELLHLILRRSSKSSALRRLDLDTLSGVREGKPFSACLEILSLPVYSSQLMSVTHFSIKFSSIEYENLVKLCVLLPNLQELELCVQPGLRSWGGKVTEETFLDDVLGLQMPSQMRSLSIDWTASASVNVDYKHRQFQEELVKRYSSLERLWICDWMKSAYLWYRTTSGRAVCTVLKTGTPQKNMDAVDERRAVFWKKFEKI